MKVKRNYQHYVATNTAAKSTKNAVELLQSDLGVSKQPSDLTGASSNAISTFNIKKKIRRTNKPVKSARDIVRSAKIKEFLRLRQEEKEVEERHAALEKRRAARMIHSSKKLYLSHRLASYINYYPPQSPIECINLTSQFTNSNSKIIKVTRNTRNLRIILHYK